jgi:hypothetical protein
LLLTFLKKLYIIFEDKKSKRNHKAIGIKVLNFFCLVKERLKVQDPGGPKTSGSVESGLVSATIVKELHYNTNWLNIPWIGSFEVAVQTDMQELPMHRRLLTTELHLNTNVQVRKICCTSGFIESENGFRSLKREPLQQNGGSALVSIRIRIHLYISMSIRIQIP